jgi:hypothetical protein
MSTSWVQRIVWSGHRDILVHVLEHMTNPLRFMCLLLAMLYNSLWPWSSSCPPFCVSSFSLTSLLTVTSLVGCGEEFWAWLQTAQGTQIAKSTHWNGKTSIPRSRALDPDPGWEGRVQRAWCLNWMLAWTVNNKWASLLWHPPLRRLVAALAFHAKLLPAEEETLGLT